MSSGQTARKQVTIVAIGDCLRDGGPGGFGTVLLYRQHRRELSGAFAQTTGRRVALHAVIAGLEILHDACLVDLYTNAQVSATSAGEPDLLDRLTAVRQRHARVTLHPLGTYQAHAAGVACLALARAARAVPSLPPDAPYVARLAAASAREGAAERTRQLDERMLAQARREQDVELTMSAEMKGLLAQIRELSTIVASKQEQLSTHTMNDRAHDRIYETLERDQALLDTLRQALAALRQGR